MKQEYYDDRRIPLLYLHEWTDGCAAQYKCAGAFADIGSLGVGCCRNFFGTAHAKGEQDSAGGVVKAAVRRACFNKANQKYYNKLTDLEAVYEFCETELTGPPSTRSAARDSRKTLNRMFFHLVREEDVSRKGRPQVKTLKGSQRLHAVRNRGTDVCDIEVKERGCYCLRCFPGNEDPNAVCANKGFADPWLNKRLEYKTTDALEQEHEKEEGEEEEAAQSLSDAVNEGEVFAVAGTIEEGESFSLILATSRVKTLDQDMASWEGELTGRGEKAIEGLLLECADEDETEFHVNEDLGVVTARSYEVICSPVHLRTTKSGETTIYSLEDDERARVMAAVDSNM